MSRIVEIPGGSATIRAPEDVKQRARRQLETAAVLAAPIYQRINAKRKELERERGGPVKPEDLNLTEVELSREDFDLMYEVQTATILAYLESWTLERDLPRTAEELDDLPASLYDALKLATSQDGADAIAPVDFSVSPDPESPTEGDSASSKSSREDGESPSITRFESSGERPPTAGSTAALMPTT